MYMYMYIKPKPEEMWTHADYTATISTILGLSPDKQSQRYTAAVHRST